MVLNEKQLSEVDWAHEVLVKNGSPLYFRDLIIQVLEAKGRSIHSLSQAMAEVHTQINMDSRFIHMGKGMWGLIEWQPQRAVRIVDETAVSPIDISVRREKLLAEIQQDYTQISEEKEETGNLDLDEDEDEDEEQENS